MTEVVDLTKKELYSLKSDEFVKRETTHDIFTRHMKDFLSIHTHQLFCRNFFNADSKNRGLILEHDCHAAGTMIMVHGSRGEEEYIMKPVETIVVNDRLPTQLGTSVVVEVTTGKQESAIIHYTVGGKEYHVQCNLDHLLTVRDSTGMIFDIPAKEVLKYGGAVVNLRLVKPWKSNRFMRTFVSRMKLYDNTIEPDNELRTLASLCGQKFEYNGVSWLTVPDKDNVFRFSITPGPEITYYGMTLVPETPKIGQEGKRYILEGGILTHNTGTGKTMTACGIIMTFINSYKKMYESISTKTTKYGLEKIATLESSTPYVLIIGFEGTQEAFFRELTNYSEFGFITPQEREQFQRYRHATEKADATMDDHRRYKELQSKIRRRFTDKSLGGFFDFKGFQELVNYLFDTSNADITLDFIEKESTSSGRPVSEIFDELINNGTFRLRKENLLKYKNSLIVADELHNTYNSMGKNSRGIVLQYLIDNVPGARFLGMTATLLNSSPAEIIDALNYVLPGKLRRDNYFSDHGTHISFQRPTVPEELGKLSYGYFSFLKDSNPKYYPRLILAGETVNTTTGPIKYFKFDAVPMSKHLQIAHNKIIEEHGTEDGRIKVPINSEIIFDITLPLPDGQVLTSSDQVSRVLVPASDTFLEKNGISILRDQGGLRLTGSLFERDNLVEWSPKFVKLLDLLPKSNGKCVIFHKRVRGSGVLLIEEILRLNGYIGEEIEPSNNTICVVCGLRMHEHKSGKKKEEKDGQSNTSHSFIPARYMLAYGQNKSEIPGILQRFNSPTNSNGYKYKILIGSKVIRESYDFKDVRHMFIMDCPVNVSMTLQIYGRAVRKNSHISLPQEERDVTIHTIVHTVNSAYESLSEDTAEIQRYKNKMDLYLMIQQIDKYRHMYAIDAAINKGTIWPQGNPQKDSLGALYYEPTYSIENGLSLDDLNTLTFRSLKFFKYEVDTISVMIKRLFLSKKIWTYVELWKTIKHPPFATEMNPGLFDEQLFIVSLAQLINAPNFNTDLTDIGQMSAGLIVNRLTDPTERRIIIDSGVYRIVHCSDSEDIKSGYYILVPCSQEGSPIVDAVIYDQRPPGDTRRILNINGILSGSHAYKRYTKARPQIIESLEDADELEDFAQFLLGWPVVYQEFFIQDCIRTLTKIKWPEGMTPDKDTISGIKKCSELILSGLQVLGATVTYEEMNIYKQASKYYQKSFDPETIIGYESLDSVRVVSQDGNFIDIAKTTLNRIDLFRDSGETIGYIEDIHGELPKFKLRKVSGEDRGIVCHTKTKEQLLDIMKGLGIKVDNHRTKAYCRAIFMDLLNKEIDAREGMTKNKYLYCWWTKNTNM